MEIIAKDETVPPLSSTRVIRFSVDNTPPTFQNARVGGTTYENYLVSENGRDSGGRLSFVSESAVLNGWVKDENGGSGVQYVLVFFTRTADGVTQIFSPGNSSIDRDGTVMTNRLTVKKDGNDTEEIYIPFTGLDNIDKGKNAITYENGRYL